MKQTMKKVATVMLIMAFILGMTKTIPEGVVQAAELSNETMEGATLLELNGQSSCIFNGDEESHYFKFTVPQDIENQWITFAVTNYTNNGNVCMYLRDSQGKVLFTSNKIGKQVTYCLETRAEGVGTWLDGTKILTPGNTYYIELYDWWICKGDVRISVSSTKDDNWGTYEKADTMTVNKRKNGKLEKNDDIDCFSITLPKDNRKYAFNVSSNNNIKASFVNGNRVLLSEVSVNANATNNSYAVKGKGQKIYVRIQANGNKVNSATYSLKVTAQKETISKLSLNSYKRNKKIIVGTTIGNATVKVKVANATYTVKSGLTGKFTVKLKKKLKYGDKIKVSVSQAGYKSLTKTYIVG